MTFKPGDRVRPRGWPDHQDMAVKLVRDGYALCELWPGSEIDVGAWLEEALEPVEHGPVVRRLPAERRERD
jgi:hypothetical protein